MSCDLAETTEEWLKYATKQICIVDAVTENKNLCDSAPDDPFTREALCLVWRFIFKTNFTTCIFHCQLKLIKSIASPPKTISISVRFR